MNLTAETFKEIIETIRSENPPREDENRAEGRAAVEGSAIIIPCGDKSHRSPVNVTVHDLSTIGICIRHKTSMRCGQRFILFLPAREGKSRGILCRVTRWQPVGPDRFEIGAMFEKPLAVNAPADQDAEQEQIRSLELRLANFAN